VVDAELSRMLGAGRLMRGEFRPGGAGAEWCDPEVLRSLRRRSMAKLRGEIEPAPQSALAKFLPAWQGIGAHSGRGTDALLRAIEQLGGAAVPASALESIMLPSRVADYRPELLDELTASGEVVWAGQGALPGGDGWVTLALADSAPLLLAPAALDTLSAEAGQVLDVLGSGGALFFRDIAARLADIDERTLTTALWDLVWASVATNDTLAPLRSRLSGPVRARPIARRGAGRRGTTRVSPPSTGGRWSLLPARDDDPTRRGHALVETLLDRHGIVTRGAVVAERTSGGFAAAYPVLKAFEETGRCRRGYFVDGLGGAQFAIPAAVDRMRGLSSQCAVVLAATDPANAYGAALRWPDHDGTHRPGRKAGALVVLVDGELCLYVERGGKSLLSWSEDTERIQPAVDALALAVRDGLLGKLAVERADGGAVLDSPLAEALQAAGFRPTPRGLRLRA
jgi:ATP-dependent Lhr-like helicase